MKKIYNLGTSYSWKLERYATYNETKGRKIYQMGHVCINKSILYN